MNARAPGMCQSKDDACVLDPPTWEDWYRSGRAGDVPLAESFRLYSLANASYNEGAAYRQATWSRDGVTYTNEACAFGHADHLHANLSTLGVCRRTLRLDTCEDEPAPFVCVCVSPHVRDRAQDPMSEDERFNLIAAAFICLGTAGFMCVLRLIWLANYVLHRHCCREADALSRLRQLDEDEDGLRATQRRHGRFTRRRRDEPAKAALVKRAPGSPEDEIIELSACVTCCTFAVALIGGPCLLLYAWPCLLPGVGCDFDYWVGCGFRLPYVDPGDTSGRLTTVLAG